MNRLTIKTDKKYITDDTKCMNNKYITKLGKLEDLEEEIGVNDLIHFLKWCVKYRDNFINRSFDSMVAFYKKAMCETEKAKSE